MHETLKSGPSHPQVSRAGESRPSSRHMVVPSCRMHSQQQGNPPVWEPQGPGMVSGLLMGMAKPE